MTPYLDSILWITVGLVGIVYGVMSVVEAYRDILALRASGANGAKKRLCAVAISTEALRMMTQVVFVGIGVMTLFIPNRIVFTPAGVGLILGELLTVATTVITYRERGEILRILRENSHD